MKFTDRTGDVFNAELRLLAVVEFQSTTDSAKYGRAVTRNLDDAIFYGLRVLEASAEERAWLARHGFAVWAEEETP